jgi:hypothetical protein
MGKFNNKFNSLDERYLRRKQNIREEKRQKRICPKSFLVLKISIKHKSLPDSCMKNGKKINY